jgi:hypothetical protein
MVIFYTAWVFSDARIYKLKSAALCFGNRKAIESAVTKVKFCSRSAENKGIARVCQRACSLWQPCCCAVKCSQL